MGMEKEEGQDYNMNNGEGTRIWRFGICACANPGRCCLSMLCPCVTNSVLAKKTQALPAPVAFLSSLCLLPLVVCFLRGKARDEHEIDGSDAFEGNCENLFSLDQSNCWV